MAETKLTGADKPAVGVVSFPKEKLLKSQRYAHRADLLRVLLKDGKGGVR